MENAEPVWSISDVNAAVRDMLENSFRPFWLRGEISNLVLHRSGHVYLTLKDAKSQLRAAFFGGAAAVRGMNLQNGSLVEAYGRISVYEVRGEYQFSIRSLRPEGIGDLQMRFEELKRRLAAEGLFDPARKKPIPQLPETIGVVTSPTGAAIRDFLQIVNRRFPNLHIQIYPAQVQGATAAAQVARGVAFFNRSGCDVIVVTRGGGSMEDLWPFNEEVVARAVAASRVPVISAVGHEIDFTICDFAADLRVPTPSAAAELVIGGREELMERVARSEQRLQQGMAYRMMEAGAGLDRLSGILMRHEPARQLEMLQRQTDELQMRMEHEVTAAVTAARNRLAEINVGLGHDAERLLEGGRYRVEALTGRLKILDPRSQLKRGYAILSDGGTGKVVTSVEQALPGMMLKAQLADGTLEVAVKNGV